MKTKLFFLLSLILLISFVSISCEASPENPGSSTDPEISTTSDTLAETDLRDMYALMEPSNIHLDDIPTDIGSLDFLTLADRYANEGNRIFTYSDWAAFFVDDASRSVMLTFTDGTLSDIKTFPYTETLPSSAQFEQITKGMSIAAAVEIVGLPFRSSTSGAPSMDFLSSDGMIYRLYANEDLIVNGIISYDPTPN